MKELWKIIDDYSDYEVSNTGIVRKREKTLFHMVMPPIELHPYKNSDGEDTVRIRNSKSCIDITIKELVYKTFGINPICMLNKNTGEVIQEFDTVEDIVSQLEYKEANIIRCLNGEQKTAYGYSWKYKD